MIGLRDKLLQVLQDKLRELNNRDGSHLFDEPTDRRERPRTEHQDRHERQRERVDVTVHMHNDNDSKVAEKLANLTEVIIRLENRMANMLQELITTVEEQTTVITSTIAVMDGLGAKLDEIIDDGTKPEDVLALRDSIKANTQKLAEATARHTIAEDEDTA